MSADIMPWPWKASQPSMTVSATQWPLAKHYLQFLLIFFHRPFLFKILVFHLSHFPFASCISPLSSLFFQYISLYSSHMIHSCYFFPTCIMQLIPVFASHIPIRPSSTILLHFLFFLHSLLYPSFIVSHSFSLPHSFFYSQFPFLPFPTTFFI